MIRFKCSSCSTNIQVSADYAGKRARCAKCNSILNVPRQSVGSENTVLCICPQCKANFDVPDTDVAKDITCVKCSAQINLPANGQVSGDGSTVRFSCGSCQQKYCVSSKYSGRKFGCVNCKQPCAVPEVIEEIEEVEEVEEVSEVQEVAQAEENFVLDEDQFSMGDASDAEYQQPDEFDMMGGDENIPSVPKFERAEYVPPGVKRSKRTKGSDGTGTGAGASLSKLLAPVFVIGFYVLLGFGALFFSDSEPDDKSEEALKYNRSTIVKMHKGKLGGPTGLLEFIDMVDQGGLPFSGGVSLGLGNIVNVDANVDYKKLDHSASGYLIRSTVELDQGDKTQVLIAVGERMDTFNYLDIFVVSDFGLDTALAELAETELDAELAAELRSELQSGLEADLESHAQAQVEKLQGAIDKFVLAEAMPADSLMVYFIIAGLLVVVLNIGSAWKVFEMSGESGFACLVPVYNVIVISRVAKSFDRSALFGVGLLVLPFVFFPALAFTENRLN